MDHHISRRYTRQESSTPYSPYTFSSDFNTTLDKFKYQSENYENSQSLDARFNRFKKKFEYAFTTDLRDHGTGKCYIQIDMPLDKDVKELFVNLLNSKGFRSRNLPTEFERVYDYFIANNMDGRTTYFSVQKYFPIYNKNA